MSEVYTVNWARAMINEGPVDAFAGCDGVFKSAEDALSALERSKDEFIDDILEDLDNDDKLSVVESMHVYGSKDEGYFEIDYTAPNETQIEIYISVNAVDFK